MLIAGIVTEVCVAFPALSAREEGYEVFVATDASGTFNKTTRDAAWARMSAAGCQLMTWFGIELCASSLQNGKLGKIGKRVRLIHKRSGGGEVAAAGAP